MYHPLPVTLPALKRKISREFDRIPQVMVQKAILNMKKRGNHMVLSEGKQFEGKQ